jgi:hypothetical protein
MLSDLFFHVGPAITELFKLGYEIDEDSFIELNAHQYKVLEAEGEDVFVKWFIVIPEDLNNPGKEMVIVQEEQMQSLLKAQERIYSYIEKSGKEFKTWDEKLTYAAGKLPSVFSKGTKYEEAGLQIG